MEQGLAQALVDGFAALGMLAYALRVGERGRGPMQVRLRAVFLLAGLFYGVRASHHAGAGNLFEVLSQALAAVLPLTALILAEALLRRHAPQALKLATLAGALLALAAALVPGLAWADRFVMGYVLGAFLAILLLILLRDRSGLTTAENGTLDAVAAGLLALAALSATDFRSAFPVGLSGLGALVLVHAAAGARWGALGVIGGVALLFTAVSAAALGLSAWPDRIRLAAAVLAALGALAVLLRLQVGDREARRETLLRALAQADGSGLSAFLAAVSRHPAFADLSLVEGSSLAAYDPEALEGAFAQGPVVAAARLAGPGAKNVPEDAREQMLDLLARHAASHAVLVSAAPLRVALLSTSAVRADDGEAEVLLFQRLAADAARSGP